MLFINPNAKVNRDIPNIGLAYAATHYNVRVIDLNTMSSPRDRFLRHRTDILGISVQSRTMNESIRIAEMYKAKYPEAKVKSVSGFLDVQCCYPYLDFEDKILYEEPFSDDYPFPDFELFDSFHLFRENWNSGTWSYAIMTSQGCPYHCIYCASRNRKWRPRSAENCFEEIKWAKEKWGIKSFQILDDCFNVDKVRVTKFCELIKSLRLNWFCTNGVRADRFNENIAKAMSDSGCKHVSLGIESVSPDVLQAVRKGETIEQIERAIDVARKYFISINGFFVIGLPKSTYEKDLHSLKWAVRKGINAHFSYYIPHDKLIQGNSLFYGEGASPVSDEYPKEMQKKIYDMTEYMRPSRHGNLLKRGLLGLRLIWMFDRHSLLKHLAHDFKRLIG